MEKLKEFPTKCPFCGGDDLFRPWLSVEAGGTGCVDCDRPFVSDFGYEILGIKEEETRGFLGIIVKTRKRYILGAKRYKTQEEL